MFWGGGGGGGGWSTLCCYHGNCIKELSQYSSTDMRTCSLILPPLASLRLKLTSDENEEQEVRRSKEKDYARMDEVS